MFDLKKNPPARPAASHRLHQFTGQEPRFLEPTLTVPPPVPPAPPSPPPPPPAAPANLPQALLQQAAQTISARGVERDTAGTGAQQERSMAATVAAFNAIEGTQLTERQGWAFMQTLKLVRASATARNGRYNADDYLDAAAYAALGAECAALGTVYGGKA